MSTLKVDGIRSNSASSDAITLASDGTCTANITNRSNRNLIINGAMLVAQRGTSSTDNDIGTVDRFQSKYTGTDEATTQQQADVSAPSSPYHLPTSGDHPYKKGFRKCFSITNGNQTSGAGAGDYVFIRYKIEARDLANSGWDYTSSSSYLTLSFWVKSSVAQNFYGRLETQDGTKQNYSFETGSLTAFTWTKIAKTIPGNANITIDNNGGTGIELYFYAFLGTDQTNNSVTNDAWAAYASGTRTKDNTSTWYTTNDASFQITGVQLEAGSVATDFEHRPFATERRLCQRYYQKYTNPKLRGVLGNSTDFQRMGMPLLVEMRADPSATWSGTQSVYDGIGTASITGMSAVYVDPASIEFDSSVSGSLGAGSGSSVIAYTGGDEATLMLNAEL